MITLYADDNTLLVEALGVTNEKTGATINDATVSLTITYNGVALTGQSWPLVLTSDSNGDYSGLISADTDIVAGRAYRVVLTVESDGNKADIRRTVYAKTRDFTEAT